MSNWLGLTFLILGIIPDFSSSLNWGSLRNSKSKKCELNHMYADVSFNGLHLSFIVSNNIKIFPPWECNPWKRHVASNFSLQYHWNHGYQYNAYDAPQLLACFNLSYLFEIIIKEVKMTLSAVPINTFDCIQLNFNRVKHFDFLCKLDLESILAQ